MQAPAMNGRFFFALLGMVLHFPLFALGENVTLVDKQGRQMSAEILGVESDKVSIKRADGQRFEVPVDMFSLPTQQLIKGWGKKETVDAKVRACRHLVEVHAASKGEASFETLHASGALGEALIEAGRPSEAVPVLADALAGWERIRSSGWQESWCRNLLGFALVMVDRSDTNGAELLRSGFEDLKRSSRSLRQNERSWIVYKAGKRWNQYLSEVDPLGAQGFRTEFTELTAAVKAEPPLEFPDYGLRTRESEHFTVSSSFSETSDFLRNAEKAWDFYSGILVGLEDIYEKGNFSPPYQLPKVSEGEPEPFRFHFYLPDSENFARMTNDVASSLSDSSERDEVTVYAQRYGNLEDPLNRFYISRIYDPDEYVDDDQNWALNSITHQLSEIFVKTLTGRPNIAFWMFVGLAYCGENEVNGDMHHYYSSLDFDAEGLKLGTQWNEALRNFLDQGREIDFSRIIEGSQPRRVEDYGFTYGLVAMLISEEESRQLFTDLILAQGATGRNLGAEEVALWFGFPDVDTMRSSMEEFIRGPKFR